MKIKEISTQNPGCYFIMDVYKNYLYEKKHNPFYLNATYEQYEKDTLNYFIRNKKANLLDFEIVEE